jgi:phosphatidate phosphatase PAH1
LKCLNKVRCSIIEGESLDIGGTKLSNRQNILTLTSVYDSMALSDSMPTTHQLEFNRKEPQKFRKIDRKLPFMHLNFKVRKFSFE